MKLTLSDLNNLGVLGELKWWPCFSVAGYIKVQNAGTGDFRWSSKSSFSSLLSVQHWADTSQSSGPSLLNKQPSLETLAF